MRLLGLFLIFVCRFFMLCQIDCGRFEDAKDVISSFKSVVDIPLSTDFKKAHRFIAVSSSLMKKVVPFGELFATALKVGLEEDQLDALLTLTKGIDLKVRDIAQQQKYLAASEVYYHLISEYQQMVDYKIMGLVRQIRVMSGLRMNVSQQIIDGFIYDCNSGLNSPGNIAEYLANIVRLCGEPNLPLSAANDIFRLINDINFVHYTLSSEEQHMFFKRFAVIYFWLVSHPSKSSVLLEFAEERRAASIYVYNKLVLLEILMENLNIKESDMVLTTCIPKAAFVAHGYKRDSIERFGDILMEHLSSLEYVTLFCANISFYGNQDGAAFYTSDIDQIIAPVYSFVKNWLDAFLESTWPTIESLLIGNIMKDLSKGMLFAETNETYGRILDSVHEEMLMIGHPSYKRQYVVARERFFGPLAREFGFGCKPNSCTNTTSMNARCISIRTKTDTNEAFESLQRLIEFRNMSVPIFFKAMDSELYRYSFVERVLQILDEKYGLNFKQFTNHSSYVLLRRDVYFSGCFNAFAMRCDEDLDNAFLQTLHYHEDGSKFTDCEDWLVILGF